MSFKKRMLPALLASTLTLGASAAQALTFNGVYVFGDSLSDAGYFRPSLISRFGFTPAQAAQGGRFTTNPDPVFAEIIAQYYGGNPNPSNAGGQNYAQGGARINANNPVSPPPSGVDRPVSAQITEYLSSTGGRADPNALYSVFGGPNDLFQVAAGLVTPANTPAFLDTVTTAEVQQIQRLRDAGAKYMLVFNLPDVGNTPSSVRGGPTAIGQGQQLSLGYNINLFNKIAAAGLRVIPVDSFSLFTEVRLNAAAFGFTNTTGQACIPVPPLPDSSLFCSRANTVPNGQTTYLFADGVHPTGASHAIFADFVKSLIDGPNAYSTMTEVALSTRAAHIGTLDEALQLGATAQVGKFSAFATGGGGKYDISTNTLSPRTDTKNRSATVGVTFRASETFTLGVGLGKTTADIDMGSVGKYETDESLLSLFGSFKSGGWYANFTASLADIKFDEIQRFVKLGPVTRTQRANTKGSNGSGSFTVGFDCKAGLVSVGPFASLTTQSVTVNGFTDRAGSTDLSTDLRIFEQKRSSQVTSVGVRASATFGDWTPFARVSFDKEEKNDDRFVTATPVTVTQGIQYDIPGYRGDSKWGTAVIGVRGKVSNRIGLAVVYSNTFSRSDVKQDGVTGTLSFDF